MDGYSDKILTFFATFIDLMLSCADNIEEAQLSNSLEKLHRHYKNTNQDVETRCNNNRLQYLMSDLSHACQMERALKDTWTSPEARGHLTNPSQFLRDSILARVDKVQVLVTGNTEV